MWKNKKVIPNFNVDKKVYYDIFICMVLDYFTYRITDYDNGDVSVRYYIKSGYGEGLSSGVIRLNVQTNVGELNQTVAIIKSMEIDGMLSHMSDVSGYGEEELFNFVTEVRDHSVSILTN